MAILIDYLVDEKVYYNPATKHRALLITSEYKYKNDVLVHLQFNSDLNTRLNNILEFESKKETVLSGDQFFSKKTYNQGKTKQITRESFGEKIKRFDVNQTVLEQEILEEYSYTDKNNRLDTVQIAVTEKDNKITAVIDFKDIEQYEYFVCPEWLLNKID